MSLRLHRISLRNFRNYHAFDLDGIGTLTIFVGPNAVGKTNIIEGIQLVTALSSFRHPSLDQVIRRGAPAARIDARIGDGSRQLDLSLLAEEGSKRYLLNGKPKRAADLKGLIPAIAFTPDDLDLVKGSQSTRRAALDALGSQLSANHYLIKKDYEKVIRYKNRLLKEEAPDALIESIDESLLTAGAQLAWYRSSLFAKLAPLMAAQYAAISGGSERLEASYIPSWEECDGESPAPFAFSREEARTRLTAALAARRGDERARRRALVGPHADRIAFFIDGCNAGVFGSQGQQRSLVLAFKLAEVQLVQDILQQQPILLLDDVMSELDAARRRELVKFIAGDIQTFITTTNLAYFDGDLLDRARVVELPAGPGVRMGVPGGGGDAL